MANASKEDLAMPQRPPYELADEYLASKHTTDDLYKLYTKGDKICENSVRNSNFISRHELRRTERLLRYKRAVAAQKRKHLDEQWTNLQKKEDSLREMFINFNDFVLDNNDKRMRAIERISSIGMVYEKRDEQIQDLTEKCRELEEVKNQMNKKIMQNKMFEDFLVGMTREYPEDFSNVIEIINRYELIKHTSEELIKQHELELDSLEKTKREFTRTVDRCVIALSGLYTRVAQLRERLDSAQRECRRWEELLGRVGGEAWHRFIDMITVRDSCRRIHVEACRRRGVKPAPEGDFVAELEGIKRALLDYRRINEMARKAKEEELAASERARPSNESV